jgi:hypothetical protein
MLELFFFILGLVNNIFLIFIFLVRKTHKMATLQRIGVGYLLLAIPAVYGIFLVVQEQKAVQYGIFLGIFLTYLALEWVYDFVLKPPFSSELEIINALFMSLFCDELWICCHGLENLFAGGAPGARPLYYPNNREFKHSSPKKQG